MSHLKDRVGKELHNLEQRIDEIEHRLTERIEALEKFRVSLETQIMQTK